MRYDAIPNFLDFYFVDRFRFFASIRIQFLKNFASHRIFIVALFFYKMNVSASIRIDLNSIGKKSEIRSLVFLPLTNKG